LALKALAFLAGEEQAFGQFLSLSGLRPDELKERAGEPQLLAAVLDFLLGDDRLLLDFAQAEGVGAKTIHEARRALPGAAPEG
jgi:hypothetical protein